MRLRRLLPVAALLTVALPLAAMAGGAPKGPQKFATTVFGGAGGEPNVAVSPDGKTVLADGLGGQSPATLYRSTDGGRHFTHLSPKFSVAGGGDWDMRWLDNNTVIAADLDLGAGIHVHRSSDKGSTWTTTTITKDVYDRPWIEHYGTKEIYLVAKGFDAVPYVFRSHDGGATFDPLPIPLYGTGAVPAEAGGTEPNPVEALVTNQDAYVDHPVVDQRSGDFYVLYGIDSAQTYSAAKPLGEPNRLYVAHLQNSQSATPMFKSYPVYLGAAGDGFVSGFNWMTIDRAGTLYVLGNGKHAGHESAWLSYSKDHGQHWSPLVDLGVPGVANTYGSIAGADPGVLSMVYLRGSAPTSATAQNWYAEIARVTGATTAHPAITRTRPLAEAVHTKDICLDGILCGAPGFGNDRNLLDYIWNAVGPDGTVFAVVTSDGPASGSSGKSVDTVYFRQTAGARNGKGVAS